MKTGIKYLVAFILGSGVGFLVARKMLEEKYAMLAQEEIDSVKETFAKSKHKKERIEDIAEAAKEQSEDSGEKSITRSSLGLIRTNKYEEAKRNYHLIANKKYEEDEDIDEDIDDEYQDGLDEEDEEANNYTVENLPDICKKPYIITDCQFSEDRDDHDKVSLYYYSEDGVLADEYEEIITDANNVIGPEALKLLEEQNLDVNIVWVRNERFAIDYEVVVLDKSYRDLVFVDEVENLTPREKYEKKSKKQNRRRKSDEEF